jgi:hypothetical protein
VQYKAHVATLKDQLDLDAFKLVRNRGIPPSLEVDLKEWNTIWRHGNPDYLASICSQIPNLNEAVRIETLQLELLPKNMRILRSSFDGNTTFLSQCTVCGSRLVTTSDHRLRVVSLVTQKVMNHPQSRIQEIFS